MIWIDGSALPSSGPSGAGAYLEFGPWNRKLTICKALGNGSKQGAELEAVDNSLSWLLENYKKRKLCEFEILHIISDGSYAQGVLLEGHNISTNRKQYRKTVDVFKRASRKWKIRWSYVKAHTGILGNQIADSLAWKGVEKSKQT